MKATKETQPPARQVREPRPSELAAAERAKANVGDRPLRAEPVVETTEGVVTITAEHSDEKANAYMVMDALGTSSNGFVNRAILEMVNCGGRGRQPATTQDLQAAFAFVGAIEPRNEVEAALAVQMFAAHSMAMDMMGRARAADNRLAINEFGNLATKFQRTFAAQMEALTKFRTGGKQVVEHRHIYVDNRGGQAVFAENMTTGGAGNGRTLEAQSHAPSAALLGADAAGHFLPGAGDTGTEAVPNARRPRGRAKG